MRTLLRCRDLIAAGYLVITRSSDHHEAHQTSSHGRNVRNGPARLRLVLVLARVRLGLCHRRGASGPPVAARTIGLLELAVTVAVAVPVPVNLLGHGRALGDDLVEPFT